MNREHLGNGVYVFINTAGQVVLSEGEEDDRGNYFPEKAIILEVEQYAQLVDYVVRAMASTLPQRSRR